MTSLSRTLTLVATSFLALAGCNAAPSGATESAESPDKTAADSESEAPAKEEASANGDQDKPAFLATLTATGEITFGARKAGACGTLRFKASPRATVFTERPTRQAVSMAMESYFAGWDEAYVGDPPNAHLSVFSKSGANRNLVVKLDSKPTWNARTSTVSFPNACVVHLADSVEAESPVESFDFGSLFIDSAKLFDWNSCYSTASNFLEPSGCMEQWGSYPASCADAWVSMAHARGKRCKNVGEVGTCPLGYFSDYDSGRSLNYSASWYDCKLNTPDFAVTAPSNVTATQGGGLSSFTVSTSTVGVCYAEGITLGLSGQPSGVTMYFDNYDNTLTAGDSTTVYFKAAGSVAKGTYSFTLTGTGADANAHSTTIQLLVQ